MLYIFTYPFNNAGGDTSNYYFMLVKGTTSLTHASGYPFIVGKIANFIVGSAELSSPTHAFAVLVLQHSIEVLALSIVAFGIRRIFGSPTALIFLVLTGCNVFAMSWTSAAYPEWLQSCALLTTLFLVVGALSSKSLISKFVLYSLSFLAFAWAYLTKYNSAALVPLFLIPLVVEYRRIGRKAFWFVLSPAPAICRVYCDRRVMLDVFLYSGLCRGDAAKVGTPYLRSGVISSRPKNQAVRVHIPLLDVLKRTLDAGPTGDLTFNQLGLNGPMPRRRLATLSRNLQSRRHHE